MVSLVREEHDAQLQGRLAGVPEEMQAANYARAYSAETAVACVLLKLGSGVSNYNVSSIIGVPAGSVSSMFNKTINIMLRVSDIRNATIPT